MTRRTSLLGSFIHAVASAIVALGCMAALLAAVPAPVEATEVTVIGDNATHYLAYKVFSCDVSGGKATNAAWESDAARKAAAQAGAPTQTAQDAADWMGQNLSDGSPAHQRVVQNLVRTISDKYFSLSHRIDLLVMKSLRAKVAAYLLSEAARAHSLTFSIPFSRIQLADYLNCDRSALSRELSTMQREGLIDTYRSSFKLLEPDALQQMVQ